MWGIIAVAAAAAVGVYELVTHSHNSTPSPAQPNAPPGTPNAPAAVLNNYYPPTKVNGVEQPTRPSLPAQPTPTVPPALVTLPDGRIVAPGYLTHGDLSHVPVGNTTANVDVRAAPDEGSALLQTIPAGTLIAIYNLTPAPATAAAPQGWYNTTSDNGDGWVPVQYVALTGDTMSLA